METIAEEKSLQILIVDDNSDFCMNCVDILESKGYTVSAVNDGFEAIKEVQEKNFDLVIMDIKMPVMNGVETFKKMKEIIPELPVIMVTAYALEELISDALLEGAFAAFHKPLDFEKLFSAIENTQVSGSLIMVVDDDRDIRTNVSDILEAHGYRTKVAMDGEEAVQMCRENRYNVILLDMNIPVLNGLETYLRIRTIRPNVVVILITGFRDQMKDYIDQTLKSSAYVCLEKPLNIDYLLGILKGHAKKQGHTS
ncbi:MAG: response regulator [Candidatus Brocadiaceae bacterium]|nr:response regulator [Candidatus Brocadiaceae bacterium]